MMNHLLGVSSSWEVTGRDNIAPCGFVYENEVSEEPTDLGKCQ